MTDVDLGVFFGDWLRRSDEIDKIAVRAYIIDELGYKPEKSPFAAGSVAEMSEYIGDMLSKGRRKTKR